MFCFVISNILLHVLSWVQLCLCIGFQELFFRKKKSLQFKMRSLRSLGHMLQITNPGVRNVAQACVGFTRGVVTESKVVSCDLPDIEIPDLTFSQMCWSREDRFKDKLALVSNGLFGYIY